MKTNASLSRSIFQITLLQLALLSALHSNALGKPNPTRADRDSMESDSGPSEIPVKRPPLSIRLVDDSQLVGTTPLDSFAIRTSYALAKIPLMDIESIKPSKNHETVLVVLKNGDRLDGTTEIEEIPFQTSFGELTIALKHIFLIKAITSTPTRAPSHSKSLTQKISKEAVMLRETLSRFIREENEKKGDRPIQRLDSLSGGREGWSDADGSDSMGNPFLIGPKCGHGIHINPKPPKALESYAGADDF